MRPFVRARARFDNEERFLAAGCGGDIAKPIDTRRLPSQVAEDLETTR